MVKLKFCPNCKCYSIFPFKTIAGGYLVYYVMPKVKHNGAIVTRYFICQGCRLIFQNPRLSESDLKKYYSSGYYRKTISKPDGGMDNEEKKRAKIDAEIIKKNVGKIDSHLDIGCGRGYLLNELNATIKIGVESDINYISEKEIIKYSNLSNVPKRKFDLVSVLHVLEHISYPLRYLKQIVRFVSKRGYLVIEVPSSETVGGGLGFSHLSFFETDVLKLMCLQAGLDVINIEFTPHLILICKKI